MKHKLLESTVNNAQINHKMFQRGHCETGVEGPARWCAWQYEEDRRYAVGKAHQALFKALGYDESLELLVSSYYVP